MIERWRQHFSEVMEANIRTQEIGDKINNKQVIYPIKEEEIMESIRKLMLGKDQEQIIYI